MKIFLLEMQASIYKGNSYLQPPFLFRVTHEQKGRPKISVPRP